MTPNVPSLMERALAVGQKLRAALDALNDVLERAEDKFEILFGTDAYGRVRMAPGEFLVYRDGLFWVEVIENIDRRRFQVIDLLKSSKQRRMMAAEHIQTLFEDVAQGMRK